jgi:hypothetical protein
MFRYVRIAESDFARTYGWYVELNGRRYAALTDPQPWGDHQFWVSYRLEVLADNQDARDWLYSDDFWLDTPGLEFRSREFGEIAKYAFPSMVAGLEVRQTGRVPMRGLYLGVPCRWWEEWLLAAWELWQLLCRLWKHEPRHVFAPCLSLLVLSLTVLGGAGDASWFVWLAVGGINALLQPRYALVLFVSLRKICLGLAGKICSGRCYSGGLKETSTRVTSSSGVS